MILKTTMLRLTIVKIFKLETNQNKKESVTTRANKKR